MKPPRARAAQRRVVVVIAACIGCGAEREISPGEIAPDDMPICDCGSPMIAKQAGLRSAARRRRK